MAAILRTGVVSRFSCLGDQCPDTCCRGWSMQMDETTLARYKTEAPELLVAVEPGPDAPWIMRKNDAGYCVKLEEGLCGIHKSHGAKFLGDACYFYPRVTRRLGDAVVMSSAPSCPEVVRLALEADDPFALEAAEAERLPQSVKDYLPDGMTAEGALAVHAAFLAAAEDKEAGIERIFARIASVSRSIERIDKKDWPQAVPLYLKLADGRLPVPEPHAADPFNLLHALAGLIVASKKTMSDRLRQTVGDMERALNVKLDWQQVLIETGDGSLPAYRNIHALWQQEGAAHADPWLRRYLQMQLTLALYPFAGLGGNLAERATIIGVRLATVRLGLMCAAGIYGAKLPGEEAVRVIQSLSRFLDHLGDPAFSLQIYAETGWDKEARMRGVLG